MISEIYDALISAGAAESRSRKAAEVLTNTDARFGQMDSRFPSMDLKLTSMAGDIALLKRMGGVVIAFNVAIVLKLFVH